jgi:gliding motility-associated-like protein
MLYYRIENFCFERSVDSIYIEYDPCPVMSLELPNVFTPNRDLINDSWAPITEAVEFLDIQIYNRWGLVVHYYSGDPQDYPGWDGHSMQTAQDCPPGTYYVIAKARDDEGNVLEESGTIYLGR